MEFAQETKDILKQWAEKGMYLLYNNLGDLWLLRATPQGHLQEPLLGWELRSDADGLAHLCRTEV
jgi:hypothetical protein